jgi:hypothetical protein
VVQILNRLVDLDDIFYEEDIEDDLDFMLFNPVASTFSKWRTFKLLKRVHLFNRLVYLDEILYCGNGIKVTSIITKWLSVCMPLITFEPLGKFS